MKKERSPTRERTPVLERPGPVKTEAPTPAKEKEKEEEVHSGSEEGEIEEG